ncbi:hypothetical protein [Mycobacterium camsae]|nr:hypothetical protein [Mycobacterium gordonae]
MHPGALAAACEQQGLRAGSQVLFVVAGAGVVAGAALYCRLAEH